MKELDEGFIDFLKRLWRSIVSKKEEKEDFVSYGGHDDLHANDPLLKQKLAKIFAKGIMLHKEAENLGVRDNDLMEILVGVWKNRITLDKFYELKQNGIIDRIYARVRERIRYQKRKRGVWHENKN